MNTPAPTRSWFSMECLGCPASLFCPIHACSRTLTKYEALRAHGIDGCLGDKDSKRKMLSLTCSEASRGSLILPNHYRALTGQQHHGSLSNVTSEFGGSSEEEQELEIMLSGR